MTIQKRLLSLFITAAMLLSLLAVAPFSVSAEGELNAVVVSSSATIYSRTPGFKVKAYADKLGCTFSESDDQLVCTGMKAKIDGSEYTVVLMGDCAPDGKVDATDIITVKRHLLKIKTLEGACEKAVAFDASGKISSTDYIKIKRYILGVVKELELPQTLKYEPLNYDVMKAVWLSQFDMDVTFSTGAGQRPVDDYRERVGIICDNCADNGFNTVILQLRPNGDSFYPSELYTPSYYVTGSYYNDEFVYDALKIFIEIAHSKNLSVQGWINPLRCMKKSQMSMVDEKYKIGEWYQDAELRAKYLYYNKSTTNTDYYYLNPAYEEVRQLIIDGAVEICTNYDIDGIHLDDYFYPTNKAEFDTAAYKELGSGKTLSQFRKNNVNLLVRGLYKAVKAVDPDLVFGISPAGNIQNNRDSLYADIDTWGRVSGYVDYLMPQLYWGFNYYLSSVRYETVLKEWRNIVTNSNVKLIPGLPFFKVLASERESADGSEWTNSKAVLKRMTETAKSYRCSGVCGFSYQNIFSRYDGTAIEEAKQEANNFFAAIKAWN